MNVYGGPFPLLLPLSPPTPPSPLLTSSVPSSILGREKEKKGGGAGSMMSTTTAKVCGETGGKYEERDNTMEKRTLYNYEAFSFSLSILAPLQFVQNKIHHTCGTDGHNRVRILGSSIAPFSAYGRYFPFGESSGSLRFAFFPGIGRCVCVCVCKN